MSGELAGHRVVVTRASRQASGLVERLESRGATVEPLSLLEILAPQDSRPLERAATELALYDWLVLTSANAVESLLPLAGGTLPSRLGVAVIGGATARSLRGYGVEPALVAERSQAEGLAELLEPRVRRRRRVLLPQAEDARPLLAERLEAAGAEVVRVAAYRKRLPEGAAERARSLFAEKPWGWVTFTSPSTVRYLVEALGPLWIEGRETLLAASIGPVTSAELGRQGAAPAAQAHSPSDAGLVDAIVAAVSSRRRS
ncbi:MAG TPA: uroporphyrinogen-III synthase [Thermoanaerobaculia bacterium]|nr:uroporphyrinogen-III synthase [Thermoanaerobaculia bacterium]